MKFKNIKYILLGLFAATLVSCETYDDQEIEYSPIWPISGEWQTTIRDEANALVSPTTATNPRGVISMRTYNTSENVADKAWIRVGTATQAFSIMGIANCDVTQKTLTGTGIANSLKAAGSTFTILEAKIMLQATTVPSGVTADSIYVRYTSSTAAGKTYTVTGHRRTQWDALE